MRTHAHTLGTKRVFFYTKLQQIATTLDTLRVEVLQPCLNLLHLQSKLQHL
jgi:hypothetical protein